jgi:ATP-dependent RNA helicase RhlE
MTFESLGLAPALLRALDEVGYTTPTPIQSQAIPLALAGHDLLGGAQTGTGKTAAFTLPLLHRLAEAPAAAARVRPVRALVLTPTRELAVQVHDSIRTYGKHLRLSSTVIYGGASMNPQLQTLGRGVDILVATPGRLIDHLERGSVKLANVEVLVLDEADRMLDMGFLPAIKRILGKIPSRRQTMLFSATFEEQIKKLALEFMREPQEVQVAARNTVAASVTHRAHPVDAVRKRDLLIDILSERWQDQVLVFGKTKHGCNRLAEQIEKSGITAVAIHGNKSQGQRLRALADFKSGQARVLVATDVAARGLDIPLLPLVVNFDLPMVAEDYVHRIGRTGRAGANGEALSLVSPDEASLLRAIHRVLKQDIEMVEVAGYAPTRPIRMGNDAPSAGRPGGNRPPAKPRRGHAGPAPRHAHAGKPHAGKPHPAADRRERRAVNAPRPPR